MLVDITIEAQDFDAVMELAPIDIGVYLTAVVLADITMTQETVPYTITMEEV